MDSVQSLSYDLCFPDEENHFYESDYESSRVAPKKKKTVSADSSVSEPITYYTIQNL